MTDSLVSVAVIEPVGGHGGMDYYDMGLCQGLASAGVNVCLYTCDETSVHEGFAFTVDHAFRGVYGDTPKWIRGIRYVRGALSSVLSAVRRRQHLCHFHFFHVGFLELFIVLLAKACRRHVVITAHDVESFVRELEIPILNKFVYRQAARVIAHNEYSRSALVEGLQLAEKRVVVIPHGNYLHMLQDAPRQAEARSRLNVSKNAKVILFFGQIKKVKGLELLLNAMPRVLKVHPKAVLIIAGKPWKIGFDIYERKITQLGIADQCIQHIRFIDDIDVPVYYSAADIVALPYTQIYQSGVLLMAMSYGCPVVVSDLPGMTEIVADGMNGYVFRSGDEGSLADALLAALGNDEKRVEIGKRGLEYVERKLDWNDIGRQTAAVYAELYSRSGFGSVNAG